MMQRRESALAAAPARESEQALLYLLVAPGAT
jgi:hypothetical protein